MFRRIVAFLHRSKGLIPLLFSLKPKPESQMSQDTLILVTKIVDKLQKDRGENGPKPRPQRGHRNTSADESKFDAGLAFRVLV
jgi:hypothetical protein